MKAKISATNGQFKLPQTQVYEFLDDQLLIFLRSWNGTDSNQKVIDEITHFLSAANADLEVTTPFEYKQSLSSLANKVRISILLANDLIFKTDNKEQLYLGYELAVIFKNHNELAWANIGRFEISAKKMDNEFQLCYGGQFLDDQILLPVGLLGLDRDPSINAGSISVKNVDQVQIVSNYLHNSTYWQALISEVNESNS